MLKTATFTIAIGAVTALFALPASALPLAPVKPQAAAESNVLLVRDGCGRGMRWSNRAGGCVEKDDQPRVRVIEEDDHPRRRARNNDDDDDQPRRHRKRHGDDVGTVLLKALIGDGNNKHRNSGNNRHQGNKQGRSQVQQQPGADGQDD